MRTALALLFGALASCSSAVCTSPDLSDDLSAVVHEDQAVPADMSIVPDFASACLWLGSGTFQETTRFSRIDSTGTLIRRQTTGPISFAGTNVVRSVWTQDDQLFCESAVIRACQHACCDTACCSGVNPPWIAYTAAQGPGLAPSVFLVQRGTCTSPTGTVWTVDQVLVE